jgi:hypothetical protein
LTKVISVLDFQHGTARDRDDRQGDGAGKGNLPALHFACFPMRQANHGAGNRLAPAVHFSEDGKTAYCKSEICNLPSPP